MSIPFTSEEFYGVFSAYNLALWPAQVFLLGLGLGVIAIALLALQRSYSSVCISGILAFLLAWQALAYHLAFFTAINPIAYVFAAVFMGGAAVFLRLSEDVVEYFKGMADEAGVPYQSLINLYLHDCLANSRKVQINWPPAV